MGKMKQTAQFIELIKEHPLIYDTTHDDYKNLRKRDKVWDEIGKEIKVKGE